jgi:histidyl-tRNA synthetase
MGSALKAVSDDVRWDIVGERQLAGEAALAERVRREQTAYAKSVTIQHVVTHGKAEAVNGTIKLKNGRLRQSCHFYEFTNAKGTSVRAITSYAIESK